MEQPFISKSDLASYLRYPSSSMDDTLANLAVVTASQAVVDFLQQELEPTDAVLTLGGSGLDTMFLPFTPVTEVTELDIGGTIIDAEDYELNEDDGTIVYADHIFPQGRRNVKISLTYGYDEVPSTIKLVALQVASRIYEMGIVTTESVGGSSEGVMEGGGTLNHIEKIALSGYRRLSWL